MQYVKVKPASLQVVLPSLRSALGLGEMPRVAFVGAGGKSIALFSLAREYSSPVIVTITAHLELFQKKLADHHFEYHESLGWNKDLPVNLSGVTLFSGRQSTRSVSGLEEGPLLEVLSLADKNSVPMFIESDGSRRHPIKAPAIHEPPIPGFVNTVVVVAGLSALGKPCTSNWVHRHDVYSQLAGIQPGNLISINAMKNVLCNPSGGLKNIPRHARKIVLLNQADTPELCDQAEILASSLLPVFDRVVVSALHSKTDAPYITSIYNASG